MDAVNVTGLLLQTVVVEVLIEIVGTRLVLITIVTLFEVAVVGDAQAALDVNTQVTTSVLLRPEDENDAELVPALFPFTFH